MHRPSVYILCEVHILVLITLRLFLIYLGKPGEADRGRILLPLLFLYIFKVNSN